MSAYPQLAGLWVVEGTNIQKSGFGWSYKPRVRGEHLIHHPHHNDRLKICSLCRLLLLLLWWVLLLRRFQQRNSLPALPLRRSNGRQRSSFSFCHFRNSLGYFGIVRLRRFSKFTKFSLLTIPRNKDFISTYIRGYWSHLIRGENWRNVGRVYLT